jgi:hypothetical protein
VTAMPASRSKHPSTAQADGASFDRGLAAEFFDFSPDLLCTANAEGYFEHVNSS